MCTVQSALKQCAALDGIRHVFNGPYLAVVKRSGKLLFCQGREEHYYGGFHVVAAAVKVLVKRVAFRSLYLYGAAVCKCQCEVAVHVTGESECGADEGLEIDLGDTWVELYAAGRDLVGTCCTFNLNRSVVESGADNFNVVKTVVIIGYLKALDYGTAAFNKVHGLYVSGYGLKMVCAVHGAHFRNPAQRAVGVRVRLFPWMLVKFGQTFVPEHFIVLAVCHNFKGKISIGTCPDVTAVTGVVIGNDELVLTESNPVYSGTPFVLECLWLFNGSYGLVQERGLHVSLEHVSHLKKGVAGETGQRFGPGGQDGHCVHAVFPCCKALRAVAVIGIGFLSALDFGKYIGQ